MEGKLSNSGMPHEGFADPVMNDGPRFHSNMPVSELTELDARAIEASVVSSAPSVVETEDGVTHEIWPTPADPHGARGLESPDPNSRIHLTGVQRLAHEGLKTASRQKELARVSIR